MKYEIVKYNSIYDDQICTLEKELWSQDLKVNKSYLKWKYFENPYSDSPKLYLVLLGGKLIALRGMYETRWQLGDPEENFIALCGADLVIHPEYRNVGILNELMNFIINDLHDLGYIYMFSFSASPVTLISSLAMGWKSIGRINIMRKNFYMYPLIKKIVSINAIRKFINKSGVMNFLRKTTDNLKITDPHIKIDKNPKPDKMASLVKKLNPKNKITLSRDEKYFSWRYKNPLSNYLFLYWHDDGLKGYLVAQTPLYNININIVELEAVNSRIKMELLKTLLSISSLRSIFIWSKMLDKKLHKFLTSTGFSEDNSNTRAATYTPTILVRTTKQSHNRIEFRGCNLLDMDNWDLKMIYLDGL